MMGDDEDDGGGHDGRTITLRCSENCDCAADSCKRLEQGLAAMGQTAPLPAYVPGDFKRNVTVLNNALENMSFAFGIMARLTEEAFLMEDVV